MSEPLTIQGPAIVKFGNQNFYSQKDITVNLKREVFNPAGAFSGNLGERMKSQMFEISVTPVGMNPGATGMLKYFPFTPAAIGGSILTGALVVQSIKESKTWTFARAGIQKAPGLSLHPLKTLFGAMTFVAIGVAATAMTDAAAVDAVTSTAFAETDYDPTKVITDIYGAAWGSGGGYSDYAAMGSHDGFEIEQSYGTVNLESADRGITDIILESLGCTVSFSPSTLTQAQVQTLLGYQDAAVILPGQSFGKADLVVTGPNLIVTAKNVGPKDGGMIYQVGQNRVKGVQFVNALSFAVGVGARLVQFADPS